MEQKQPHIAYQSLYLFIFSFSPMEISITDFSPPIGVSVFKVCVHLQVGKMYCVNKNKDAYPHCLPSFFNVSFFSFVALI